ncbi:DeoR family transcriptional regulator, partial [Escherichia coli]|uniref:DeoR family transcriptional regulator n=1 Tax=Escherichia coli TaxID=562 RepID=UPI00207B3453
MKFERHHEILKRLSKFGSVKVSDLSNSLNVTKETIRSDLNELARLGYLTRCHGGAFIVLDSLDTIAKNEISYALENYDTAQGIKKGHSTLMNPLMILVKIIKLRWIHILSYDQMVSRKINNQTTRCANSIFYTTLFTNS